MIAATTALPRILITQPDMHRLRVLLQRHQDGGSSETGELLELELDRAEVVPQAEIPPDVITMRSQGLLEDLDTGQRRTLAVVYPEESDVSAGKISVLVPVGAAMLGLKVGDTIAWPLPSGRSARLRLVAVLYQPEASGELHL